MPLSKYLFAGIISWFVIYAIGFFVRDLSRKQLLLFGYFLLPIIRGLDGGYIQYPVNANKIYLVYILFSNLLFFDTDKTVVFLRRLGPFLITLLFLNVLSYLFVLNSTEIFLKGCLYFVFLFLISLFAYNARITIEDIASILPGYFYLVLLPIFIVCILEIFGNRELAMFFAGPQYEGFNYLRFGYYRINGIFHWPNNLAEYLGCFFILYLSLGVRNRKFFYFAITIFVFLIPTIVRVQIAACVLLFMVIIRSYGSRFIRYGYVLILAIFLGFMGETVGDLASLTTKQFRSTNTPRVYYVLKSIGIAKNNFPLGEGILSTASYQSKVLGEDAFKERHYLKTFGLATSDTFYSELLIEYGVIGSIIFIMMILWFWFYLKGDLLRYFIVYFAISAFSLTGMIYYGAWGVLFWLLVGIYLYGLELANEDDRRITHNQNNDRMKTV